jgi:hydroxypyruvate isomerase
MQQINRRILLGSSIALAAASTARASRLFETQGADTSKLAKTPHTRFACNIEMWGFGGVPYEERIKKAHELGFSAVEFWPWRGKDLDKIEKACKDFGIEVAQFTGWGFSPGMNNPANHAKFVEETKESCKVANRLGAKCVLIVAGNNQPGMTLEEMHQHVIDGLKLVVPVAEEHDITLVLEPMNGRVDHPGHCLYGSEPAVKICKAVNSPRVKICWDLYHMQISEGDLCGHLKDGKDWIGYVQLADHPGRYEPGTGEVHYARVLKQLYELGYRGYVGVECNPSVDELTATKSLAVADQW